ncbi:hypothetical protein EYF80_063908 [Liparis tanakae]|uniref:Uncharacterized protein n=1 Tax=Liparis tanakae TaxID=230148 RepID=A0A4Z2EAU1_9TELE|nr:hypothetical protein EYF80_063908 [Liparis tanakae]
MLYSRCLHGNHLNQSPRSNPAGRAARRPGGAARCIFDERAPRDPLEGRRGTKGLARVSCPA